MAFLFRFAASVVPQSPRVCDGRHTPRAVLLAVYSVDVLTSMPAGLLSVFKLKLQLEKISGTARAIIRINSFFMAFNFAAR